MIKLKAYAKINLSLAINGTRADGYHLIDTVMQSIDIYDTVEISKDDTITVISDIAIPMESNIAYKAAKLFFEKTGIDSGAKITIKKAIPEAAGLGGGSADAAAVLIGLDSIYSLHLDKKVLCDMALQLGADVPFFIEGGTVRCSGIGEVLQKLPSLTNGCFVVVKHGIKPSTKEMYKKLDSANYRNPDVSAVAEAVAKNDVFLLSKNIGNCFSALWQNQELNENFLKTQPLGICLSGSGPSVFALYENQKTALKAAQTLEKSGFNALVCEPKSVAIEKIIE